MLMSGFGAGRGDLAGGHRRKEGTPAAPGEHPRRLVVVVVTVVVTGIGGKAVVVCSVMVVAAG